MSRDALYARYSSHAQDGGTSIDVQIESCERAAGGSCVHYIDRARTGKTVGGRRGLQRLIADVEAGKIDRVFVYKWDRLGRAAETHVIVADIEDAGVEVVSATEGRDALGRGVQLVVAQEFSRSLAERTRAGLVKTFERQSWAGGPPPYGLKLIDCPDGRRWLAIDESESVVVRRIFSLHASGLGLKNIARRLNDDGVAPRRAELWSPTSVRGVLTGKHVMGVIQFGRRKFRLDRETGRRLPSRADADQVMETRDESIRIVSDDEFDRSAATLAKHARRATTGPSAKKRAYPFTGLLKCGNCGAKLYVNRTTKGQHEHIYYRCSRRYNHGVKACDFPPIPQPALLDWFMDNLRSILNQEEAIIKDALDIARASVSDGRAEAAEARKNLQRIEQDIKRLTTRIIDPMLDDLPDARLALSDQLARLQADKAAQLKRLDTLVDDAHDATDTLEARLRSAMKRLRETLNSTDSAVLKAAVEDLAGPATLSRVAGGFHVSPEDSPKGLIAGTDYEPVGDILTIYYWAQKQKITLPNAA